MGKVIKVSFSIIIVLMLMLAVVLVGITPVKASSDNIVTNIKLQASDWVTSGAKLDNWEVTTKSGKVKINTIKIDLQNPYIEVGAIYGDNGKTGDKQKIIDMANEAGAVAAINGDFFTLNAEGAPFGVTIKDGIVINSPGYIGSKNTFMLDQYNIPLIERLDYDAFVTAQDGAVYRVIGLNKTQYQVSFRLTGGNSHINQLNMYDDKWNMNNWVGDKLGYYTMVLVENGIVTQILDNTKIDTIPNGAYVLLGNGEAANYLKTHVHIGEQIDVKFMYNTESIINTAIDGSTLLVENGQKAKITYEIKGNNARSAVGYSQDNRYVYFVTVEKGTDSVGMTLDELSSFLVSLNIWEAVNLDGGGSTTLVARPLGQYGLVDITIPQYGAERSVPNGLAIYTTAPKGKMIAMDVILPEGVLLNETISLDNISAYDQYYNPVSKEEFKIAWTFPQGVIYIDNTLSFNEFGAYNLKATIDTINKNYQVKVYERKDVAKIEISQIGTIKIHEGMNYTPAVKIYFEDGSSRNVDNSLLDWQLIGLDGTIATNGTITANSSSSGIVIASYQGFSTSVPVVVGVSSESRLMDAFDVRGSYALTGLTGMEISSFSIINDYDNDRMSGVFNYNFGAADVMRIAYLNYGTVGKFVNGEPAVLTLDVNGDNSGHWLRTTIKDNNGKIYYVDLAKNIDWVGWRTVSAQLPSNMAYPISIESIYVAHMDDRNDRTAITGQLTFADLKIYDWNQMPLEEENPLIVFTINQKKATVNSEKIVLDQAPIVTNGRTYIPIRYAAELLGGKVLWVKEEKKVQIIKDNKIYDLWLDEAYINENGTKKEMDAKAYITNGRTMIPLRALSESFGMYIDYDSKTKNITVK